MMAKQTSEMIQPLNVADYFTLAMDDEIRRNQLPGGLCGFALQLNGRPDINKLARRIDEFITRFPTASASLQQRGKQFYWCRRPKPEQILFQHHCPETDSDTDFQRATIVQLFHRQESRETIAPIEFHLILGQQTHCFLIRWLHPFCDAKGVELIFRYLCTDDQAQRELFDTPTMDALVNTQLGKFRWWQKIHLFYKANRYINQLDHFQSIQHGQFQLASDKLNFLPHQFSPEETDLIAQQARQHCGLTGTSQYYIGCFMRALHQMEPDQAGDAYCVPYAFSLRKQNALSPMLGNHIGTLFAQAPKALLAGREQLFSHLKQQNAQAIRQQLDYAFLPVMWAASWLSLEKYGRELRKSYQHDSERSSFWFSDIGQFNFDQHSFFNTSITGLFHLSQMSNPPGLALLCCQYRKQLILSFNFIEPVFSKSWISQLQQKMAQELLGQTE